MLYNHGCEKQQLKEQKGLDQKGSGRQRNPPKEILPRVKRTISKAYGWTKIYIRKITLLLKISVSPTTSITARHCFQKYLG